jgi:tetratricopeptide (TPR) repeat protein
VVGEGNHFVKYKAASEADGRYSSSNHYPPLSQGTIMSSLFASSRWLALASFTILIVGCSKKVPNPESAGVAPAVAHTGAPLTEDDCREFGEKLQKAIAIGDTAAAHRLFRINNLLERSISDLDLSASEKKGVLTGAAKAGTEFPAQFIRIVKEGGNYSLLRVRIVEGRPRVLMRLITDEGALNYHEFTLVRYPDQEIATEDVYIYTSGEPLSQTFRRLLLGIMAENRGGFARLREEDKIYTKNAGVIGKMAMMVRNGQSKEALDTFRKLPAELQKNKVFQIVAIQAASGTGDDNDYLTEMERFRRDHPNDPAAEILSIDYYLLKKNYGETLKTIDRLDKSLGGDPYLDCMRASAMADAKKFKEARTFADKAIKDAPKIPQAYWTRTTVATMANDHDDTLKCLKVLVEKAEPTLEASNLQADERFAKFVTTAQFDEFKKWLASRPK